MKLSIFPCQYNCIYSIRFVNFITNKNFNTKITPKIMQTIRTDFVKHNADLKCLDGSFIPEDKIRSNYEKLVEYVEGVDETTTEEVESLSKTIIRNAGRMFYSLNSCPSFNERLYFQTIYGSQTQSMVAKSALNIARYAKIDIQPKALRIFLKITSVMGYKSLISRNDLN